jgi:hypothetical protein
MTDKPIKNRRQRVANKLPNINQTIIRYMAENNIKGPEIEDLTGVHRNMVSKMRRSQTKMYLDTCYMFSQALGENFFAPLLEILYLECPECKYQDPLWVELERHKAEAQRLKKEVEYLKGVVNVLKETK